MANEKMLDGPIGEAISKAEKALQIKRQLQAEIQNYRDFLNGAKAAGVATPEQTKWIEENLPRRTRGPRTPKATKAAA